MNRPFTTLATLAVLALVAGGSPAAKAPRAHPGPASPLRLEILFTSDLHGHIDRGDATFLSPEFPPPLGGGASAATYVRQVRDEAAASGAGVLLFDSGDLFQGTPLGAATGGGAILEWMNRTGYDAATLGNHDFDRGRENTERLCRLATFPVLASNLRETATGRRPDWVKDGVMLERAGLKIAVLGYITESTTEMSFAKNVAGLEFRPVLDQLREDVSRVRHDGADLVLVLLHHGMPYVSEVEPAYHAMLEREARGELEHPGMDAMELAHAVPGVDVFFGGHTHQGLDHPWEDPRTHALVFEPYANGSSIGHVTLSVDPGTRRPIGYETHFDRGALLTLLEDEVWPDTSESRILGGQVAEAERGLEEIVGRSEVPLAGGPAESGLLGFLMADAFRIELGADCAVQNTGGVRGSLTAGEVTERDLLQVAPFGNDMVTMRVRGSLLRGLLEDKLRGRAGGLFVSGIRLQYDPGRPDGDRIVALEVAGAPIDTSRVYTLAVTNYLAEGNSGMERLQQVPSADISPAGFTDREILGRYIRRLGVIRLRNDGRWIRLGARS